MGPRVRDSAVGPLRGDGKPGGERDAEDTGSGTEEDGSGSDGEGDGEPRGTSETWEGQDGSARQGGWMRSWSESSQSSASGSGSATDVDSDTSDSDSEGDDDVDAQDGAQVRDLFHAVSAADLCRVQELLAAGTPPDRDRRSGDTPLYTACNLGFLDIVHELVDAGASLHRVNSAGFAPLHVACMNGRTDVVNLLLSRGADPNGETELCRRRPLHIAVRGGYRPIVSLLLKHGADVTKRDLEGNTLLHLACLTKQAEMLGSLVTESQLSDEELKRAVNLGKPITEWTALHVAAQVGLGPAVQILVGAGANVKVKSNLSQYPLHVAAQFGRVEVVRTLLQLSTTALFARDGNKATPLFLCCKYRSSPEAATLLVQYGSKTGTKCGPDSPKSLFENADQNSDPVGVVFREALIKGRRLKHVRPGATKKKFISTSTQVINAQRLIAQLVHERLADQLDSEHDKELLEREASPSPAPAAQPEGPKRVYEGFGNQTQGKKPEQECACAVM